MQQLGQKFLQKYHCPVYPVVCCCRILLAKIHTKMLSGTRASRWKPIWYGTFFYIHIYILDTQNSSTKTACYAKIVKYKNNSIAKSVLLICSRRIYLCEKMHSREKCASPRQLASLRSDRFNQHLRYHSVNYRNHLDTRLPIIRLIQFARRESSSGV